MSQELDLSNQKNWKSEDVVFLSIILDSLKENYSSADIENELKEFGYIPIDLLDQKKLDRFQSMLQEKYPD